MSSIRAPVPRRGGHALAMEHQKWHCPVVVE